MKKNFLNTFFVTLIFTAFSANAQIRVISTVGQDNSKPTAGRFETPTEVMNWVTTGNVPEFAKKAPYDQCTGNCQAILSKNGAELSLPEYLKLIYESNQKTHYFKNGPLAEKDMSSALMTKFEETLFFGQVDFQGNSVRNMATGFNTLTNTYSTEWVEHKNVGVLRCLLSKQNEEIFIIAKDSCGQPYPFFNEALMIIQGKARLVSAESTKALGNLGPVNPGPTNPGPSNTGPDNAGGSLTFDQILAIVEALKPSVLINAGNNNGNNNGGQGGTASVGGGGSGGSTDKTTTTTTTGYTDPQGVLWTPMKSTTPTTVQPTTVTTTTPIGSVATTATTSTQWQQVQPQQQVVQTPCNGCTGAYDRKIARATTATAVGSFVGPLLGVGLNRLLEHYFPTGGNNYVFNTNGSTTTTPNGTPADWVNGGGNGNCPAGMRWNGTACVF